jgi:hypothetical protein
VESWHEPMSLLAAEYHEVRRRGGRYAGRSTSSGAGGGVVTSGATRRWLPGCWTHTKGADWADVTGPGHREVLSRPRTCSVWGAFGPDRTSTSRDPGRHRHQGRHRHRILLSSEPVSCRSVTAESRRGAGGQSLGSRASSTPRSVTTERCRLLFRLICAAYETRSLAVASHSAFGDWGRFLADQPLPSPSSTGSAMTSTSSLPRPKLPAHPPHNRRR